MKLVSVQGNYMTNKGFVVYSPVFYTMWSPTVYLYRMKCESHTVNSLILNHMYIVLIYVLLLLESMLGSFVLMNLPVYTFLFWTYLFTYIFQFWPLGGAADAAPFSPSVWFCCALFLNHSVLWAPQGFTPSMLSSHHLASSARMRCTLVKLLCWWAVNASRHSFAPASCKHGWDGCVHAWLRKPMMRCPCTSSPDLGCSWFKSAASVIGGESLQVTGPV